MLKDIVASLVKTTRLPEITGERCVYALFEQANCQACVQVCPQQAWRLDDDSLGLDTERCDGCGLCTAACPQQAIQPSFTPVLRRWQDEPSAWCVCEKTALGPGPHRIPCLHAISLQTLLKLYRQGCRQFIVSCGDCEQCLRGQAPRLDERLKPLNQALQQRGYPPIELHQLAPEHWQTRYAQTRDYQNPASLNRRQFLRRSAGQAAKASIEQAGLSDESRLPNLGELLPSADSVPSGHLSWPYVPVLDESRCNGCDACLRLCPHDAIQNRGDHYHIEPQRCSGCGICADACDQNALTVQQWQAAPQTDIALRSGHCRACGAAFHYPSRQDLADDLCRICRQTRHYKALYQVHD